MKAAPPAICGKSVPVDFCSIDKRPAVITDLMGIDFLK